MPEAAFREIVDQLRNNVAGIQAVVLLGLDGTVPAYFARDPNFRVDVFASEYSTLLRVACSASHDIGSGELTEYITVSERSVTVVRRLASNTYLILTSDAHDQMGRARYEIKRAALFLDRQ